MSKNLKSVGVHDGSFHADEVTAVAFLLVFGLVDEDKIIRTRSPDVLASCEYVCDVGGIYDPSKLLFDHHQSHYTGLLSSAGMILQYLKDSSKIDEEAFLFFQQALVVGVDDHDNGRAPQLPGHCTFSHVVANFVPPSYESTPQELDAAFFKALAFVKGHVFRLKERYFTGISFRKIIKQEMDKKQICLFFDRPLPWLESFFALGGEKHQALFVIMPTGVHWKLRGIPPSYEDRMSVRVPLPKKWAGLLDQDLKKASGIPGAIFCHKGRFISVWETKQDALSALKMILNKEGIPYEEHFFENH